MNRIGLQQIIFGVTICLVICASLSAQTAESNEPQEITAAVLKDFPPLYQLDKNNRPTGFAIDVLEHVAAAANLRVRYKLVVNWAQAMQAVRSGKADLIPGIGISPAREKEFSFTDEIESVPVSCFVRAQNNDIRGIDDLNNIRTAVISQSAAYTRLKKGTKIQLVSFGSVDSALFALLSGGVDAFVFPKPVLEKKAREINVEDHIKTVGKPLMDLKRGFLLRKSDDALVKKLNPHIHTFIESQAYIDIYQKWYGHPAPFWNVTRIFVLMLSLLIASAIVLTLWRTIAIARMNRKLQDSVTKLKNSENALRTQQTYLRTLQDNTPDAMYLNDMTGRIIDVNAQSCEELGYSREELLSMTVMDLDGEYLELERAQQLWSSSPVGAPFHLRCNHRRKDGSKFPVEVNAVCLEIEGKRHILGFARDLSERLKMEEQMRQSQKMQAIGQLAGGIAHDFNNILAGIMGYADLALDDLPKGDALAQDLKFILQSSERAKKLVQQILAFSRHDIEKMVPLCLSGVIKEVIQLLSASIPSSIQIVTELDENLPLSLADATKIHEVLMNLATNAVYAMKEKGELRFELKERTLTTEIQGCHNTITAGTYSVITVSDTGTGIPKKILDSIFEPFFTTKPIGEGTGMGLSVVYGVMVAHKGDIVITTASGQGTAFELYFPQVEATITPNRGTLPPSSVTGSERILFVDDEPMLAELAKALLKSLGYQVTVFVDSPAALEQFRHTPKAFDLVITDQTMPSLTGLELVEQLRKIRPEIPIIICTGYSTLINETNVKEANVNGFIMKPYRKGNLSEEIRRVRDETLG